MILWTFVLVLGVFTNVVGCQCSGVTEVVQLKLFKPIIIKTPTVQGSSQYEKNLNCSWLVVTTNSSNRVLYDFTSSGTSEKDYVKVFKGHDDQGIPVFDSTQNPPGSRKNDISDTIFITFVSDEDTTTDGVSFFIYIMESMDTSGSACDSSSNLTAQESVQHITSIHFPGGYSKGQSCSWNILANEMDDVVISLYYLDVEPQQPTSCYDWLKFNDMDKLCNDSSWHLNGLDFTFKSSVSIIFSSDNYGSGYRGFLLSYKKVTQLTTTEDTTVQHSMVSTSASDRTLSSTTEYASTIVNQNTVTTDIMYSKTESTTVPFTVITATSNGIVGTTLSSEESTENPSTVNSTPKQHDSSTITISGASTTVVTMTTTSFLTSLHTVESSTQPVTTDRGTVVTSQNKDATTNHIARTDLSTERSTIVTDTTYNREYATNQNARTEHSSFLSTLYEGTTHGITTQTTRRLSTANTTGTTISPEALGGIITVAVVGVAIVGILLGVIVAMVASNHLRRSTTPRRKSLNTRDQRETPDWIRMLDSMKPTNTRNTNIEHGIT